MSNTDSEAYSNRGKQYAYNTSTVTISESFWVTVNAVTSTIKFNLQMTSKH